MKQNEITVFKNEQFGEVRTIVVKNEPYFSLSDVCKVLEIKNSRDAKTRLNEAYVVTTDIGVQTGTKKDGTPAIQMVSMDFINESNLYKLIFQSRKKEAQIFADWVTEEVLPSIRKTGKYEIKQDSYMIDDPVKRAERWIEEQKELQSAIQTIEKQKPKVLFSDAVQKCDSTISIGDLSKLINQNGICIGRNRLFSKLREDGFLMKKGSEWNMPTQKSMDMKLFVIDEKVIKTEDDTELISKTVRVTGKGQIYFVNKFLTGEVEIED